jgi:hypothetical protein
MSVSAAPGVRPRSTWSFLFAYLVTLVPLSAAAVATGFEIRAPTGNSWWVVEVACFAVSPLVAAVATERAGRSRLVRLFVAATIFATFWAIWILNVQEPTRAGVFGGGSSPRTGAVIAASIGLSWWIASGWSSFWLRRDHVGAAFVFGAVAFGVLGFTGLMFGMEVS